MADVRITQYPQKIVIADDDIFLIADSNDVDVNGFLKYKKVKAKDLPSIVNTAENITYANLIGLMAANGLITSTFYRITNSTSGVSPLLVQAVSNSTISYQAFDGANPLNTINYDVTTDTIRWNSNQSVAPVPSTRTITAGTGLTGGGDLTANRTFAIDSTVATLTGTQTLTNKTITSPVINEILDSNGNEILGFTPIASATDYITIKNGIGVGVPLHISAAGSSANTGLHLEPKGTGLVQISDGTDATKGIRFRSSGSATSAVTLIDAVSSAGRVITLPNATGTVALTSDLTAYVPTTRTVSTTSPLAGGGNLGADLTLSIPQASGSVNGYLSSTDWTTFNNKQNALTNPITGTGTTNYLPKFTGASALGNSLLQEGTSAIGLGVTPLAWNASFKALQIGTKTALWDTGGATQLSYNAYNDGATKYLTTGVAMRYFMTDSGHTWSTAPSGTAGGALTFTSAMTLDASGNLGVGATLSAWYTTFGTKAIQFAASGSVYGLDVSSSDRRAGLMNNAFINSSGNYTYINTGHSTQYEQNAGKHTWSTAASGTAGNAITFTAGMTLDASGQLLIGTTTSSTFKLDVVGTARVSSDATINGVKVGRGAGNIATNTAVGFEAINANTSGTLNTAIGYQALVSNTTGGSNTALGRAALQSVTTASNNTAVGVNALQTNVAANNTAFGYEAALSNTSGTGITAIGYQALKASTGVSNTAVGSNALTANTTGANNTALGKSALIANTTGFSNTAIGESVLLANVGGTYNTAIGSAALSSNVSGSNNIAIGRLALQNNTANNNTAVGFESASANTSAVGITAIGYQALKASTGANNTALGGTALTANTTGTSNTAIGFQSLLSNTTGIENTAIGLNSLVFNVSGSYNTAIGRGSLQGNTIGNNNTAVGFTALLANTANNNTAFGHEAATANTTGTNITAIGYQALKANTTGVQNTALGSQSLQKNTTGISNIGIGLSALLNNLVGNSNIAIGVEALLNSTGNNNIAIGTSALSLNTAANNVAVGFEAAKANTSGIEVTAIGHQALKASTGSANTAIGKSALTTNTTGAENTGIGSNVLFSNTTGQRNIAIGSNSMFGNTTGSNCTAIGWNQTSTDFSGVSMIGSSDIATGSNQMRFGSAAINNGAVATEVVVSDRTWAVFINGVAYKILLKA